MYLYMKQRFFSLGQSFDIWDNAGNVVYTAQQQFLSFGAKLRIYDTHGNEVLYLEQRLFSLPCSFDIHIRGRHVATVRKVFQFFKQDYEIEGPNWDVDGDYLAHDYTVRDAQGTVMRLEKRWMTWSDTYEMNIADRVDPLLCLGIAIAIDVHQNNHD